MGGPAAAEGVIRGDSADRDCRVVLRSANRIEDGRTTTWTAAVDVSADLASRGVVGKLLLRDRVDPIDGARVDGAAAGYQRFAFRFRHDGEGPVEMIPFVQHADGRRVIDHNRQEGDYVLSAQGRVAIAADPARCTEPTPPEVPLRRRVDRVLRTPNGTERLSFQGRQGDHVQLDVAARGGASSFVPRLVVSRRGSGEVVLDATADASGRIARAATLPADGTYVVEVRATDGRTGPYSLEVAGDMP